MKTRYVGRFVVYKGKAEIKPSEWVHGRPSPTNRIANPKLSKQTKTKIAMLDLMDEGEELPCCSKKIEYTTFTSYWIYGPVLKYRPVRGRDGV